MIESLPGESREEEEMEELYDDNFIELDEVEKLFDEMIEDEDHNA